VEQRAKISAAQLVDPVRAAQQDEDDGKGEEEEEELDAEVGLLQSVDAEVPDQVVGAERDKAEQREDLEGEAGQGNVDADVVLARRLGRGAAAAGLEGEGGDVAGDEDPVEELRVETRQTAVETDDAVRRPFC
jgi:hypothetical protein